METFVIANDRKSNVGLYPCVYGIFKFIFLKLLLSSCTWHTMWVTLGYIFYWRILPHLKKTLLLTKYIRPTHENYFTKESIIKVQMFVLYYQNICCHLGLNVNINKYISIHTYRIWHAPTVIQGISIHREIIITGMRRTIVGAKQCALPTSLTWGQRDTRCVFYMTQWHDINIEAANYKVLPLGNNVCSIDSRTYGLLSANISKSSVEVKRITVVLEIHQRV